MTVNRRQFLSLTGASVAATQISASQVTVASLPIRSTDSCDVCIVGAGFSGLMAASRIYGHGKSVVVVEARDRLGGRTWTDNVNGSGLFLDVGGQWIGPSQHRINKLVKQHHLPVFSTHDTGENAIEVDGKIIRYTGAIPKLNPAAIADLGVAMARLDSLAKTIVVEAPWLTPDAVSLDSVSLAYWIEKNTWTRTAANMLWGGLQMIFSTPPPRISLLHALYVIKVCDGLDILFGVTGGAQQDRFLLGTKSLADKLAEPFYKKIVLNSPVTAINQSTNEVEVVSTRARIKAKRVIVAVPPSLQTQIDFSPMLSYDREVVNHSMPLGAVIKILCIYPTPFWRFMGLSGQGVFAKSNVFSTFDNSVPNRSEGILVSFIIGDTAARLQKLTEPARRNLVLNDLQKIFGPQVINPSLYNEHIWAHDPWSRGAFFGNFPTGILTSHGKSLWEPAGRIHWASTETARSWMGYIEGALESGERAASEVLPLL